MAKTKAVGVRLTPMLEAKLRELCALAQREPSTVLRALLAGATVESLPRAWREASAEERRVLAEIDCR
jgi:hypothetical protein